MRIQKLAIVAVFGVAGYLAATAGAHDRHGHNVTTRGKSLESCADLEITYHHLETARAEETRTIAKSAIGTLDIPTRENSGVHVIGWDRDEYSVTACKAAAASSRSEAERLVGQIKLDVAGGRVTTPGPSNDDDWMAYLIVRVPKGSSLAIEAHNGPIGLRGVSGRIRARTVNGPLSFENCSGTIEGDTQNGPINIEGNTGDVRLRAQNGPLNVDLSGTRWEGSLVASTENGPINLHVPESYASAVRVDASGHSPVSCTAQQCKRALRTWEHPSRIEFGSGEPIVRLSTVNGPVSVE